MDEVDEHERELLSLIIQGLTDDQIASRLFVSPSTLRRRIGRLMNRAGARNRHHLCAIAAQRGWIILLEAALPEMPKAVDVSVEGS